MQIQKVNSSQSNQNFNGRMVGINPSRYIDVECIKEVIQGKNDRIFLCRDKSLGDIEIENTLSLKEIVKRVNEAKTKLEDTIINLFW